MKTAKLFRLLTAGFALAFLGSCDTNSEKEPFTPVTGTFQVDIKANDPARYYSFSAQDWVTDPKSQAWDVGFVRPRVILTNSGDTAQELVSSGKGGVWYTTKADSFEDVVLGDQVTDGPLSEYNVDVKKWIDSHVQVGPRVQNVMVFPGYEIGNGTESDKFKTLKCDQKQFYRPGTDAESNGYPATRTVYIIRHSDGIHYSKFQIDFYKFFGTASSPPNTGVQTDRYHVKYETLN